MKLARIALLSVIFSGNLIAQDVKIVGTLTQPVKIPYQASSIQSHALHAGRSANKAIVLLKIELSQMAKERLAARTQEALVRTQFSANLQEGAYPAKVELGMNEVPVLDQGMHGSCVTFANTAAVDAALNRGDYLSQLCQLQLGSYLEKNGYSPSGWHGSWGRTVLAQMDSFGIVSKEQQRAQGCGGLTEYPIEEDEPESQMSVQDYHALSENLNEQVFWSPVLDGVQALSERIDTNKTLNEVKEALAAGDRLTFGVLLLGLDVGFVGAIGKHNIQNDSWLLTTEIAREAPLRPFGGHEMVITGYDDDAIAIDDQGREHRGLLTLRNSWGAKVGDQGNFYMSYSYFKALVLEVQRIRKANYE